MSKMDALRAMREARYAEAAARASKSATPGAAAATGRPAPRSAPKPRSTPRPTPVDAVETEADEAESEALCGHRNMGGRTCTREAGHAAKSHRYS